MSEKSISTSYSQFLQAKHSVQVLNDHIKSAVDIEFFKNSISLHYQHLYRSAKTKNTFYRMIFFGFSLLFVVLGLMMFFKTTNPICSIYLGNCSVIKNEVNFLCGLFSVGAFTLGMVIHPEKEALKHIARVAKFPLKINFDDLAYRGDHDII